ncbi:MAG: hypothetical protein QM764_20285 [Chitinophagaceae bacterium]
MVTEEISVIERVHESARVFSNDQRKIEQFTKTARPELKRWRKIVKAINPVHWFDDLLDDFDIDMEELRH